MSQFTAEIMDYIGSQKSQLPYDDGVKQIYHILCHAPTPSLLVKLVAFIIFKTGVILLPDLMQQMYNVNPARVSQYFIRFSAFRIAKLICWAVGDGAVFRAKHRVAIHNG